jgi:hypothetical protein
MSIWSRFFTKQNPSLPVPETPSVPPPWVGDFLDALQKSGRVQARVQLSLEDLHGKVEAGFADLRAMPTSRNQNLPPTQELLDALDALDEAARIAHSLEPTFAEGLTRLAERLARSTLGGHLRLQPIGSQVDPARFRVVGTEPGTGSNGLVTRVVRAAVIAPDGSLIREGEVFTTRSLS